LIPLALSAIGLDARARRPSAAARAGFGVLAVIALVAIAAPWIVPYNPLDQDLLALNQAPDAVHWLGTDHIGRDVLSRVVVGARTTLVVGLGGAAAAFVLGAALGLPALAFGRVSEAIVFGVIDLVRAMPNVLLALLLIVAFGSGLLPVATALGISFAPFFAHVARATYQREIAQGYVTAARTFGGGTFHVLALHVLPNVTGSLVTQAAILLPRCVVTESVLSFLGLGSSPDAPTWGRMIADASRHIEIAPHAALAPVCALVAFTVALSLVGDHVRRALDPLRGTSARSAPGDRS
jgi:ABC-type dipeptide/oligopeptide/nickel transport system permease subunit